MNQGQYKGPNEDYMDYDDEDMGEGDGEDDSMLQSHIEANEGLEKRLQ